MTLSSEKQSIKGLKIAQSPAKDATYSNKRSVRANPLIRKFKQISLKNKISFTALAVILLVSVMIAATPKSDRQVESTYIVTEPVPKNQ